jgi:hypothetical protein
MSSQYDARNDNDRRAAWARKTWFPDDVRDADLLIVERPDFFAPVDAMRHLYDEKGFAK